MVARAAAPPRTVAVEVLERLPNGRVWTAPTVIGQQQAPSPLARVEPVQHMAGSAVATVVTATRPAGGFSVAHLSMDMEVGEFLDSPLRRITVGARREPKSRLLDGPHLGISKHLYLVILVVLGTTHWVAPRLTRKEAMHQQSDW